MNSLVTEYVHRAMKEWVPPQHKQPLQTNSKNENKRDSWIHFKIGTIANI